MSAFSGFSYRTRTPDPGPRTPDPGPRTPDPGPRTPVSYTDLPSVVEESLSLRAPLAAGRSSLVDFGEIASPTATPTRALRARSGQAPARCARSRQALSRRWQDSSR